MFALASIAMIEIQHRAGKHDRIWISAGSDVCALLGYGLGPRLSDRFVGLLGRELTHRGDVTNPDILVRTILRINKELWDERKPDADEWGLGAAVDLVAFHDGRAFAVHIGNSRIYHVGQKVLRRLSTDHSWVGDQVSAGAFSEADARTHPLSNVLTRMIPLESIVPEVIVTDVAEGDRMIVLTHSVWRSLNDVDLLHIVTPNSVLAHLRAGDNSLEDASIIVATIS